jgi:hypothetical protein
MPTATTLRIVLLDTDGDVWCDWCALPCATVITYVVECDGATPVAVHRLAYCEGCEEEASRR